MSDLISRQAVYEYLESKFNEYDISIFGNEFAGKILDGIDDIPTAYDVDAVVEQVHDELFTYDIPTDIVDDVVRRGGVND